MPNTVGELEKRPEAKNLIGIYSSLTDTSLDQIVNDFREKNFSEFKDNLSQALVEKIVPISMEIKKLLNDKKYLEEVLSEGSTKANNIASQKIKKFKKYWVFK